MRPSRLYRVVILAAAAAAPVLAQDAPTSVWDGVFSDEQATRGKHVYAAECAPCHGARARVERFAGRPLSDLHAFVRARMPDNAPGRLSAGDYAAVTAYMLRSEGFPAGARALPAVSHLMSGIVLDYDGGGEGDAGGDAAPE